MKSLVEYIEQGSKVSSLDEYILESSKIVNKISKEKLDEFESGVKKSLIEYTLDISKKKGEKKAEHTLALIKDGGVTDISNWEKYFRQRYRFRFGGLTRDQISMLYFETAVKIARKLYYGWDDYLREYEKENKSN